MSKEAKNTLKTILTYAVLILMALVMLVPFAWMISASLKLEKDVFSYPIVWIPKDPVWSNYQEIWKKVPLLQGFFNTTKLTVCTTILQLLTSSFAAYAFAKLEFKGRDLIFMLYVMTIAIPWQVYMVPQYKMMTMFHLVDSHLGLILMHAFTATGVFLIRQFFMGIPTELLEAARIDGLSEYGIWAKIMLPLSKPVIASISLFYGVGFWNDYFSSMIYLKSAEKFPIQIQLRSIILLTSQISEVVMDYYDMNGAPPDKAVKMACTVIATVPILCIYPFVQKYFTKGVMVGAVKG